MEIRAFEPTDMKAAIALWHETGLVRPWNDPRKDIARKFAVQPELFLVGFEGSELIATAMGGYDGHRGSVYYFAVAPRFQSKGHGAALIEALETKLIRMGCPKLNLLVRADNEPVAGFYKSKGYAPEAVACFGKRLIAD